MSQRSQKKPAGGFPDTHSKPNPALDNPKMPNTEPSKLEEKKDKPSK